MTADFGAITLSYQGALFAASLVGLTKLCGESKFVTDKVVELAAIRQHLSQRVFSDLHDALKPVLSAPGLTRSFLLDDAGSPIRTPAELTTVGEEAVKNVLQEFVDGSAASLANLLLAQRLEVMLLKTLGRLRFWVLVTLVFSACASLLMLLDRCNCFKVTAEWVHVALLVLAALFVGIVLFSLGRISLAVTDIERLKHGRADIS